MIFASATQQMCKPSVWQNPCSEFECLFVRFWSCFDIQILRGSVNKLSKYKTRLHNNTVQSRMSSLRRLSGQRIRTKKRQLLLVHTEAHRPTERQTQKTKRDTTLNKRNQLYWLRRVSEFLRHICLLLGCYRLLVIRHQRMTFEASVARQTVGVTTEELCFIWLNSETPQVIW